MRRLLGSLTLAALFLSALPAHAEKLMLNLRAGQLMGVTVASKAVPAQAIGGFYVRLYTVKTGANLVGALPSPLPERFALDIKQRWQDRPTLTIALPSDQEVDSGFLNLRSMVTPGRTYLLRFAHKGDHVGGQFPAIVHVRQLNAKGEPVVEQSNMDLLCGSYDWKEETFPISVMEGATTLEFAFHHPAGTGQLWMSIPTLNEVQPQPTVSVPGLWGLDEKGQLIFSGKVPGQEIGVFARVKEGDDAIRMETTVITPTAWVKEHPIALVLGFRLPVNATGWKWGDYIGRERTIEAGKDYRYYHTLGLRQARLASWFPLAAVSGPEHGIALAVPLAPTTFNRLSYSPRGYLNLEFDLGLAARTRTRTDVELAQVAFDILRYQPRWGYRAALEAYYRRYPTLFASTAKEGGWWIGPTPQVPNLHDFGLQYSEDHFARPDQVKANNQQGLYTCSYSEPWMWRIETMGPEVKGIADVPPYTRFLPQIEQDADLPASTKDTADYWPAPRRDSVRAFLNSVQYGPDGKPRVNAVRQYAIPVIELSTCALPKLRSEQWGEMNRGLLSYQYETLADQQRCAEGGAKLEGVYFDSIGDWSDITAEDHRADHFPYATYPLTFSYATGTPVISGLSAMAEYMQFIREKQFITMANSDARYAAYAAPFLDMIGAGENFYGDDAEDAAFSHDRMVAYHKSVSFGNTGMLSASPEEAERRFRLLLFYHIYPGIFAGDPEPMEQLRPLYRKYVPLMQAMGAAGWEPVTWATVDDPAVRVERYGPGPGKVIFLALRNPEAAAKSVALTVELDGLGRAGAGTVKATDALGGTLSSVEREGDRLAVKTEVPGRDTIVVRLDLNS